MEKDGNSQPDIPDETRIFHCVILSESHTNLFRHLKNTIGRKAEGCQKPVKGFAMSSEDQFERVKESVHRAKVIKQLY